MRDGEGGAKDVSVRYGLLVTIDFLNIAVLRSERNTSLVVAVLLYLPL